MKHNPFTVGKHIVILKCFLVLSVLLVATSTFSQKKDGYLGLDAGVYVFKNDDPAVGAHFSGNAAISKEAFIGAELGVVGFQGDSKPYLPLLARFSYLHPLESGKTQLLILLAPGYGAYSHPYTSGNTDYKIKGGFTFFGGVGAAFKGKRNGYLTLTVGYQSFGFNDRGDKYSVDGAGIRLGGMFR